MNTSTKKTGLKALDRGLKIRSTVKAGGLSSPNHSRSLKV
jgi:hypothetical protein